MKRILDSEKLNIIGSRVKEARTKAGLSQKQLSEKLELLAVYTCRGSISRIENGQRAITDIEIDAISKVLNVSLDYLFGREWLFSEEILMDDKLLRYTLRVDRLLFQKFWYIAESEGRSANKEIEQYLKKRVAEYEQENGKIEINK